MSDLDRLRASRELFLAAFAGSAQSVEGWVLDRLTACLEARHVTAGQRVFEAGDSPDSFYLMRNGAVRLTQPGRPDRVLRGRCVLGMFDIFLDRPRVATATALSDGQLMKVPTEEWMELLDDSFDLARMALLHLGLEVARLEERLLAKGAELPSSLTSPGDGACDDGSLAGRLSALMDSPFLRNGGVQSLGDLALVSEPCHFRAGQALVDRATAGRVVLVLEGIVESRRERPDLLRRDGPGEFVSGAAAFTELGSAWHSIAIGDTRALSFRIEDWFDLMEEHFSLLHGALVGLARRHEALLSRWPAV
jgi:CRP-like cAMP-binding protein